MTQAIDTIIHCRYLIPIIPRNSILHHHSVAINHGEIIDILDTQRANKQYQASNTYHLNDHALLPGFINAHTHIPMNLFRGLADDLPLMTWLQEHIWKAEASILAPNAVAIGTQMAIAEMLLSGTTCFFDMFFFTETILDTTQSMGIRAKLSLHIMDVANQWAQSASECIEKSRHLLQTHQSNPLVGLTIAPHSPYTNDNQALCGARELADQYQLPMMIHLHETKREVEDSVAQFKQRPIARLNQLGFLKPDVLAVHMVHLNEEDLAIVQQTGISIAHCPESNLKLGSGLAPISELLKQGINVALGTDSVASNNDLDMLGEMRQAAFLQKGLNQDPAALPAHEVLEMATINGARAMNMDQTIGSIEVGKAADLCAINLNTPFTQPCYNPIAQIVYAANRDQITHVWVNGQIKVENRALVDINFGSILSAAQPIFERAAAFKYPKHNQ